MATPQLLRRLRKVLQEWPVDTSRKGRDLGEYLRDYYSKTFEQLIQNDPGGAARAVQSLEKLNSNYYRHLYHREKDHGFSGDLVVNNPWMLSNKNVTEMNRKTTFWQRLSRK